MKQSLAGDLLDTENMNWTIVNDDVMGGQSKSRIYWLEEESVIRFEGVLSLKNNGGFASIRSVLDRKYLSGAKSICIDIEFCVE